MCFCEQKVAMSRSLKGTMQTEGVALNPFKEGATIRKRDCGSQTQSPTSFA